MRCSDIFGAVLATCRRFKRSLKAWFRAACGAVAPSPPNLDPAGLLADAIDDCREGVTGAGVETPVVSEEFSNGFMPSSRSPVPGVSGAILGGIPEPFAFKSSSIDPARCSGAGLGFGFFPVSGRLEVDQDSLDLEPALSVLEPLGGVAARVGVEEPECIGDRIVPVPFWE